MKMLNSTGVVLASSPRTCVEEADREVGWVRVGHNPTYTNAPTNYDANEQREGTNVSQRAASHRMEQVAYVCV
jgi:hypothetical protein